MVTIFKSKFPLKNTTLSERGDHSKSRVNNVLSDFRSLVRITNVTEYQCEMHVDLFNKLTKFNSLRIGDTNHTNSPPDMGIVDTRETELTISGHFID